MEEVNDNSSMRIKTINNDQNSFMINGHIFKIYHCLLSREDFFENVMRGTEIELVQKGGLALVSS